MNVEELGPDHVRCAASVVNPMGLHARPASLLVETANRFQSNIQINKGSETVDAKSILQLLTLFAEAGSVLMLEARGADAKEAITALAQLIADGFHEMEEH